MESSDILWLILALMGAGLALALVLALFIVRRVRPVDLPEEAGFFDALRSTPLVVAIFLDILDLALDGFGAPLAWWVLGKVGLRKLRGVAVVEALIPATQIIPTMTICWVLGKVLGRSRAQLVERALQHSRRLGPQQS